MTSMTAPKPGSAIRKGHFMRILILASLLALPLGSAAMAEGLTFTGDKGGTIVKTRDCVRGTGQVTCSTDTTYTGAEGQTAFKSQVRVTEPGSSATEITLTGPDGNTRTRKRLLTWGD
jgi:hypothetical protein